MKNDYEVWLGNKKLQSSASYTGALQIIHTHMSNTENRLRDYTVLDYKHNLALKFSVL